MLLERSVYTHSLLFICGDACLCVCSCTHIHIHVEAREQPQVSSLKSCPPLFWRSFLTGLELTGSPRLVNLQTPCISLPLPHLPSSPLHPKIASILYNILSFFNVNFGVQTQVFMITRQAFSLLNHSALVTSALNVM